MQTAMLKHSPATGWSAVPFPALDGERTLVLAFGSPSCAGRPAVLDELRAAYPRAHFLGCSTSGEIAGATVNDESLVACVARFERSELRAVHTRVPSAAASEAAGREVARALLRDDLRAVIVLADGLNVNGSEVARGLNATLPPHVVATGGLAGDGDRFRSTWVLGPSGPESRIVTAVGLYGADLRIGWGSRGGWDPFGPERLVTRSSGNVLYELDGRPALALYKEYLGELAAGLPATGLRFPLAVRDDDDPAARSVVRTILAVDEQQQSMTFAGDVPQGSRAQLMQATMGRLVDGAGDAAAHAARTGESAHAVLAIAISCVGRRLILGQRTEEELEASLAALPAGSQQVGFYSYGEISPLEPGSCDLHNQTMTLTTLAEA